MEKEKLEKLLIESDSLSEVILKLGLKVNGGTRRTLKKYMSDNGLVFERNKMTREKYNQNPKICPVCGKEIDFEHRANKYCSSSCAAKVNNVLYPKKKKINANKRKYPETRKYEEKDLYCVVCGKKLTGNQKKFCSDKCKRKFYSLQGYQTNHSQKNDKLGALKKYEYIIKLGGKCSVCGYDKNLSALTFHHTRDKEFTLNARVFSRANEEDLKKELDKCILLCQNCHHELHHPDLNKEKIKKLLEEKDK